MKLDTTKVYYLGDLSDEQLEQVYFYCEFNNTHFSEFKNKANYIIFCDWWIIGTNMRDVRNTENIINAKELFNWKNNKRIAQIQLRIQELNNELIELDEEMRKLTYK